MKGVVDTRADWVIDLEADAITKAARWTAQGWDCEVRSRVCRSCARAPFGEYRQVENRVAGGPAVHVLHHSEHVLWSVTATKPDEDVVVAVQAALTTAGIRDVETLTVRKLVAALNDAGLMYEGWD